MTFPTTSPSLFSSLMFRNFRAVVAVGSTTHYTDYQYGLVDRGTPQLLYKICLLVVRQNVLLYEIQIFQ